MFSMRIEFGQGRERKLGTAESFEQAVSTIDRLIGTDERTVASEPDTKRMQRKGQVWSVPSPRRGSTTSYVVTNEGKAK